MYVEQTTEDENVTENEKFFTYGSNIKIFTSVKNSVKLLSRQKLSTIDFLRIYERCRKISFNNTIFWLHNEKFAISLRTFKHVFCYDGSIVVILSLKVNLNSIV